MEFTQFCDIIKNILHKKKDISLEQCLYSDLELCSLDMMILIIEIEKASGKQIDVSSIKKDMTVNDLLCLINE